MRRNFPCAPGISWNVIPSAMLMLVAASIGCGESKPAPIEPEEPPPAAVASLSIDPSTASLIVGEQRTLAATVRDATGTPLNGRAVQWTSSAPTVVSVTATGNGAAATITAIATGTATITASSEGKSVNASVTSVRLDVSITDAQWTQGVQRTDGMLPMILDGNAAVLNVLLSATAATSPGDIVLRLTDASGALVRADTARPSPFSGNATYASPSAQFLVPTSTLRHGLYWQVVRDPQHRIVDDDSTNDRYPRFEPESLATVRLAPMRIRFVPITLSAHANATGAISSANLESYLPTLRRIFPMGALETSIAPPLVTSASFGTAPSGGTEGFWVQVLQDLDLARVADTANPRTYWVAVVRPPSGFNYTSFGGYSYIPSNPASTARGTHISAVVQTGWFTNTSQTADLVTHELGHALGRRHSPCGGPSGIDLLYPNTEGSIGVSGHDVYAWANGLASRATTKAATTGDVMGYCFPQWASPYTYEALLQARIESEYVPPVASAVRGDVAGAEVRQLQQVMVVRARVNEGQLSVLPAVMLPGFPTIDDGGTWRVDLLDADGRLLASQRTRMRSVDHGTAQTLVVAVPVAGIEATRIAAVQVSGPSHRAVRRRSASVAVSVTAGPTIAPSPDGVRVACPAAYTQAMVVQDALTGAVLAAVDVAAAATSGVDVPHARGRSLHVTCSDGVHSTIGRVQGRLP